jgi:hypothetical protein
MLALLTAPEILIIALLLALTIVCLRARRRGSRK